MFFALRGYYRIKTSLVDVTADLKQKEDAREQFIISSQAQISKLKDQLNRFSGKTFLTQFEVSHIYTLLAKAEIRLEGKLIYFGLVSNDQVKQIPFVTSQSMSELHNGDQFSVFGNRLAGVVPFQDEDDDATSENTADMPVDNESTVQFQPKAGDNEDDGDATMLAPSPAIRPETDDYYKGLPYLKVIEGADKGAVFYLLFITTSIGRDASSTIALDDHKASRVNTYLRYESHHFVLEDNKSTNGTLCNDELITSQSLNFGDVLTVGASRLLFSCEGYELREKSPEEAIVDFELCLQKEPNFIAALKNLAFLLERDIRRKKESGPIWKKIEKIERKG